MKDSNIFKGEEKSEETVIQNIHAGFSPPVKHALTLYLSAKERIAEKHLKIKAESIKSVLKN